MTALSYSCKRQQEMAAPWLLAPAHLDHLDDEAEGEGEGGQHQDQRAQHQQAGTQALGLLARCNTVLYCTVLYCTLCCTSWSPLYCTSSPIFSSLLRSDPDPSFFFPVPAPMSTVSCFSLAVGPGTCTS